MGLSLRRPFIETGDVISMDIPNRRLEVELVHDEMARPKEAWVPPQPHSGRGFGWMFLKHVEQADKACVFDFLLTRFGALVSEPEVN